MKRKTFNFFSKKNDKKERGTGNELLPSKDYGDRPLFHGDSLFLKLAECFPKRQASRIYHFTSTPIWAKEGGDSSLSR
ncbi:MAG: hypothetical protein OEW45_19665 [Deltaproteobacteria bacterium]|nr:hypothetical protein [Deltaproteobacteria bacterium]